MDYTVRQLSEDEYPLWDKLVTISPQRSIFAQRWWMDIVTRGGARLLGCFDGERLVAGLPIWPSTTLGVKRLRQPPLTPYWGPVLIPLEGKYVTRFSTEVDILRALALALAPWRDIMIACHPTLGNWLPFYWNGFSQTTRYTFRVEQLAQNLQAEKSLHRSIRCALNRATSNRLTIREMVDPMVIAEMSRLSMARQELQSSAEIRAFWPQLSRAAEERHCMLNAAAYDPDGNIHAGYAMVWDDRYAYHLYGGGVPKYRELGGGTLALLHLLQQATTLAPSFDFEGSMVESIGRFFRQFGGELTAYSFITRARSRRLNLARAWQQRARNEGKTEQRTPQQLSTATEHAQMPAAAE